MTPISAPGAALHWAGVLLLHSKTPSSCQVLVAAAAAWKMPGKRGIAAGRQRLALPTLPGCSGIRGTSGQGQQSNRDLWSLITCFVFSGAHIRFCYRIIEEPMLEAATKDLLVQPLTGKGTLSSTLELAQLENLQRWGLYHILGRLF